MKVRLIMNEPKQIPVESLEPGQVAVVVECPAYPGAVGEPVVGVRTGSAQGIGQSFRLGDPTTFVRLLQPGEKLVIE